MSTETGHEDQGQMDIADHVKTWHGFVRFMKWQTIAVIALMIFLALFRTHS